MGKKRVVWNKFGRYVSAVVIAAFFMPFFGVSCDGMDVISVSGADMVGGCKPGGLISEAEKESKKPGRDKSQGGITGSVDNVEREPLAIAALGLAIAGFVAAWIRTRKGLTASFALALATLGVLIGLYFKVGAELKDAVAKETKSEHSGKMMRETKVEAGGRFGLWLTCLLLVGEAVLTGRALKEGEEPMPTPAPIGPPPGPPPTV